MKMKCLVIVVCVGGEEGVLLASTEPNGIALQ